MRICGIVVTILVAGSLPAMAETTWQGGGVPGWDSPVTRAEPAAASATGLLASDPEAIAQAMRDAGFLVTVDTDGIGDPMLKSRVHDTDFWVYFLDCTDNANCKAIQFHSGYALDRAISTEEMNDFNRRYLYIRSFLNSNGDPRMQMDLMMQDEGMGRTVFERYLRIWSTLVKDWEAQLGLR